MTLSRKTTEKERVFLERVLTLLARPSSDLSQINVPTALWARLALATTSLKEGESHATEV